MTSRRPIAAIVLSLILPAAHLLPPTAAGQKIDPPKATELQWTNLETAVAKGAEHKKPVMVDVYTDWCGWCKKMDKEVFADPAVSEVLGKHFALAKVNGESRETFTFKGEKTDGVGIARGFGVRGYPAIIFLDSDGDMLTMIPGFVNAEKFLPIVLFIGTREFEKMEWPAYLAKYEAAKQAPARPK